MALCHLKLNEPEEALACCDEVRQAGAGGARLVCIMETHRWALGWPLPTQALSIDRRHLKALYRKGLALEELGRLSDALKSARRVRKLQAYNKVRALERGTVASCWHWARS